LGGDGPQPPQPRPLGRRQHLGIHQPPPVRDVYDAKLDHQPVVAIVGQTAIMARHHTPKWILAGAAVDATHAATMALLAAVRPDRRKLALTNVASATMLAVSGVYEARHAARHPTP
jgi:hypothetical protein